MAIRRTVRYVHNSCYSPDRPANNISLFKLLKSNYNRAADNWMTSNPGQRITLFEMAGIFCKANDRAASVEKAKNRFETTGL